MNPRWQDWALVAIIGPVLSLCAVWAARRIGHWLTESLEKSFAQVVLDVMAPDMAHLGTKLAASINDLGERNTADHHETAHRLLAVEERQTDVEARLAAVESRLNIRPPDARTRATDSKETPSDGPIP